MPDREKVIEILEKAKTIIENWIPMFEQYNTPAGIDGAIDLLKEQPEIVRCRECKEKNNCEVHIAFYDPDWYCADGKRRDDDD